ncbi:cysteine-rich CWC family protein [Salinithrix halophila]|uniref:Cysteine-rich CWC family protein n=1 Tax=Salinithrix halophila TaxID=1485204 RepID=A0ABV8JGA0_9BACL
MVEPNQAAFCPICGKDNDCGNLAGKPRGTCWCDKEVFPPEILERVSSEQRKACICQGCVKRYKKE